MKFDKVSLEVTGSFNLPRDRINKETDENPFILEAFDNFANSFFAPNDIKTAFSRQLLAPFRNKTRFLGSGAAGHPNDILSN